MLLFIAILRQTRCESENENATDDVCSTQACRLEAENILSMMDVTVDKCENFYLYACGTFINETVIPDDKSTYDVTTVLDERMREQLNEILNTSVTEKDIYPFALSKRHYAACLNEGK